jgi:hypothetical protein
MFGSLPCCLSFIACSEYTAILNVEQWDAWRTDLILRQDRHSVTPAATLSHFCDGLGLPVIPLALAFDPDGRYSVVCTQIWGRR